MAGESSSSSIKYLPIYALKKNFKYIQNLKDGHKPIKSVCCLTAIWSGIAFGALFPFFVWPGSVEFASDFFFVDPNWFIALMVVLTSISVCSNAFYLSVKSCFYLNNYLRHGHIHTIFKPITSSQIERISAAQICLKDRVILLDRTQILTIHAELLEILKNKKDKPKIKQAYEKFMKGDVVGAMIESPLVSHKIAETFEASNVVPAHDIRHKYTPISLITDRVSNPAECTVMGRIARIANILRECQEELVELSEIAASTSTCTTPSLRARTPRDSIELSVMG